MPRSIAKQQRSWKERSERGGSASPENASPARTDGKLSRRRREYQTAQPHQLPNALRTTRSTLFLPSIRRLSSLPLVTGFLILFSSSFVVRHFFFSLRPFGSNRSLQNFYENCLDILPRSSVKRRSTPTITPGGKQKCKNKITLPSMRIFFELRSSCFCFSPSA